MEQIFSDILKEIVVPRIISKKVTNALGFNACKGFILEGHPGTGKTLIARTLGKLLNAHIKIVRGPEVLSSYVGESPKNVR
jgi:vesicle-fusing ATPase